MTGTKAMAMRSASGRRPTKRGEKESASDLKIPAHLQVRLRGC